jgi:GNAT superfamily N-acetyltransferase
MVEIRACRDHADERVSLEIYNAVWPAAAITMAEVESFKAMMRDYGDHLAVVDGEAVGAAAVAISPTQPGVGLAFITVLPERRGEGAGTTLYAAASRWLAERGIEELDALVPEDDERSLAWARRRGFREVERDSRLILDLAAIEPPPLDPPPGVAIVPWARRPELARGIYQVACEAYPDIPQDRQRTMEPFEDWLEHDLDRPDIPPTATFVALAGDEVIGYAILNVTAARPKDADHAMTGVKRRWRGRGVAGALKRAQIAWAKEQGFERLQTQNEIRNEPIRRLNERLGYGVVPGRVIVRGPIARN